MMNKLIKLTLILLSLTASNLPVAAQSKSMENLPNGRYLFCDNPPLTDGVSIVNCFDFQKTNTQFIGYYFPINVRYGTVCINGKIKNNVINGEAVYMVRLIDNGVQLDLTTQFRDNKLKKMSDDDSGRLRVARAIASNGTNGGEKTPLVKFRNIELKLNGLKRYKPWSTRPIPKNCTDWP